jgi:hypothetical protein
VSLADVERAIAIGDPQLAELTCRYLAQGDAEAGRDELDPDGRAGGDDAYVDVEVPDGVATIETLRGLRRTLPRKTATERKLARREAFDAAERSAFAPPRLRLGRALVAVYETGDEPGRAALLEVFERGTMKWGVWQAAKHIYKLAEARHDAAMFGVLAYRFDAMAVTEHAKHELSTGTLVYLRKRAWRYLRLLGNASLDAYPTWAVEVLRHYPEQFKAASWVASHIFNPKAVVARGGQYLNLVTDDVAFAAARGHAGAWKLSPAPLLRLLEVASNDVVCEFAIRSLRVDHALALRAIEPAWLAQLGRRSLPAIHRFVVQLLRDSPDFHQSKLRALGLHDMVLALLASPANEARAYALEYAAAHAADADLPVDELVRLVELSYPDTARFAAARLEQRAAKDLGLPTLLRLLGHGQAPWAAGKLAQGFAPTDITAAQFVDTMLRSPAHVTALIKLYNDARAVIPAGHWTALLDDRRSENYAYRNLVNTALGELAKRAAKEIGVAWLQRAVEDRRRTQVVARWLDAGMLSGDDLDVDWLRGLVAKPRLRAIALKLLGDRQRVAPSRVGMDWLLELTRSPEAELATFAQRMLLESFEPADLGGVPRLWELATGKVEATRAFAALYLRAHHPEAGPRTPEAKALGIKPRLGHDAYAQAIVRPLLDDDRADVRRLAAIIASEELARWGDPQLVYALAASPHREPRALASEWLLGLVTEGAARKLPAAWLDAARVFALAEAPHAQTREGALTLIRRLYDQIGDATRLAWLMDSPDRDVRLFAVRLFWDRHRPASGYVPRKQVGAPKGGERFADLDALRRFLRVVMFGLPPGRMPVREPLAEGAPAPERPLAATVAKRRLIETLRDAALTDVDLARAIAPVLGELSHSVAKGEWQASVQALVALRARHGELPAGAVA